ncbi:epimerase [Pedobacter sp. L105]|uniref:epimerase n=1 Tax=Pedobacter sp. L105 TaxID=1641871 RepID=UPI00131D2A35|nr:epimerase [Pedobacter sp. L105]
MENITNNKVNAIITGASGMVGEGVLQVCLQDPNVASVLVINRKALGVSHPKLKEIIHADFFDLSAVEDQLIGYNACFFCLGVTSVGKSDAEYYKYTYTLTMKMGETLSKLNSGMTFCYVSGGGTDSTEQGKSSWARTKGKTENDLMKLPFKEAFAFRPGFIKPMKGLKHSHAYYKYINWLYPIGRLIYPKGFNTLEEVGLAMIHITQWGYKKNIIEGTDIAILAK